MNVTQEEDCRCQEGVFPSDPIPQMTVACIDFVLISVVLWASYHVDKKDLCRMYTLWLYLSHAPFDLAMLIMSFLQMNGIVDNTGRLYTDSSNLVPLIGKLFQDIASQVYRILALLMVFITYTSYRFPFFYQKIFKQSRRLRIFLSGFIFIVIEAVLSNTVTLTDMENISPTWNVISLTIMYMLQAFGTVPIAIMIVLYFVAIHTIVTYAKNKARRGESTRNQRRQLLSVILYSTSPNILLLPLFMANVLIIIMDLNKDLSDGPLMNVYLFTVKLMRYCNHIRIPVITISTFAAFAPYRSVLIARKRRSDYITRVMTVSRATPPSFSSAPTTPITRSST
ncbi:hypothetical protein QR680_018737 [Steinernema hermaphroditum]|uniref:G-protein coupled receptors family 1 profile domain-containing protein n=1 Tax=Steinernema hermaphroditum TaxID=289476 RepID=A0AA39HK59_9BILA|nr:hypothetical protein QR680_018737 [Steinernema hermaphroditum]